MIQLTFGWFSRNSATFIAFSWARSIRIPIVFSPLRVKKPGGDPCCIPALSLLTESIVFLFFSDYHSTDNVCMAIYELVIECKLYRLPDQVVLKVRTTKVLSTQTGYYICVQSHKWREYQRCRWLDLAGVSRYMSWYSAGLLF